MAERDATVTLRRRDAVGDARTTEPNGRPEREPGWRAKDVVMAGLTAFLVGKVVGSPSATTSAEVRADRASEVPAGGQLRELEALVAEVGEALGACTRCLGQNPGCSQCQGAGKPDPKRANRQLFDKYVRPVGRWAPPRRNRHNPPQATEGA